MSTGKRKSLSESLIQQFVKDPASVSDSLDTEANTDRLTQTNIEASTEVNTEILESTDEPGLAAATISVFKSNQKEATTRFTVDLPRSKHQRFAIVSKQLNTNMSSLARVLIEKFLTEIERDKLL